MALVHVLVPNIREKILCLFLTFLPLLYHLNFLHEIQREPFILYFCHFPESPSSFKTQLPVPVTLMFIVVTLHYLGGQTAAQPRQHLLH